MPFHSVSYIHDYRGLFLFFQACQLLFPKDNIAFLFFLAYTVTVTNQKKRYIMNPSNKMLSVIIPSYNEEAMIQTTFQTVKKILSESQIPFEIIFVDDGSRDGTYQEISRLSKDNPEVHGISFSRNFGKESAIFAGLAEAKGACCVIMDCDLQHPPCTIIEMYHLWEQGYEASRLPVERKVLSTISVPTAFMLLSAGLPILIWQTLPILNFWTDRL